MENKDLVGVEDGGRSFRYTSVGNLLAIPPSSAVINFVPKSSIVCTSLTENEDTGPREPPDLPYRIAAHIERILVHDAGNLIGSATDAVFVGNLIFSVLVTIATRVFIGRLENVTGLVRKDLVNIVRPPSIVAVLHAEFHSTQSSVGEMGLRKFGEECDISASRVVSVAKIVGEGDTTLITLGISERFQSSVTPDTLTGFVFTRGN